MPTIHVPDFEDLSPEQRSALDEIAEQRRVDPDEVSLMHRSRIHWPEYMKASLDEGRYAFKALASLPEMTKEGISTTISMVNNCEF